MPTAWTDIGLVSATPAPLPLTPCTDTEYEPAAVAGKVKVLEPDAVLAVKLPIVLDQLYEVGTGEQTAVKVEVPPLELKVEGLAVKVQVGAATVTSLVALLIGVPPPSLPTTE